MFKRKFDFIEELKREKVFKGELLKDIRSGEVFPAIRNNRVDFYYKGGKLFSFGKKGLSTHIKYATTPEDNGKNYITEKEFSENRVALIKDFAIDYCKIKRNCELYFKGSESAGVSHLYSGYSFMKLRVDVVVLDVEISLESIEDRSQDRIDVLLYSRRHKTLKFVEAKLYANQEIRSNSKPRVIKQIERYNEQIRIKENEILDAYKDYLEIVKELFDVTLNEPVKVLPGVGLYIFDFDDDQKKGNLSARIIPNLNRYHIKHYTKGDFTNINAQTLWSKVTKI